MNEIYLASTNGERKTTIKGDRFPLGDKSDKYKKRTGYQLFIDQLTEDHMIYLFSDGFQDQFGGPEGKKFLKKEFRELLFKISPLSIEEQKNTIAIQFNNWKKNKPQIDDVLVVGLKLKIK